MAKRTTKENYVNNREFLDALMVYRKEVATREIKPRIPNYLGECFLKIATHLSYKPNFVNYMFREDMISDGIENCVQYIDRFNPEKSTNPFAYFTQIIYYAFLRRIAKEKKQLEIKNKILERSGFDEVLHMDTHTGDMNGYNSSYSDMNSMKENLEMRSKR
jgi:DNA-directed RNA polymerase specialized sigma24 family protein